MRDRVLVRWAQCAGLALWVWTSFAHAIETVIDKPYEEMVDQVETVLAEFGVTVERRASTDRLHLIVGNHQSGTRVTLSLRILAEGSRARLLLGTDSPVDRALENRIAAQMAKRAEQR